MSVARLNVSPNGPARFTVTVEFYGIPRHYSGVGQVEIDVGAAQVLLGDLLLMLADRYPQLAVSCFSGRTLRGGFLVSVDGAAFVSDPDYIVGTGQVLLILSADAGG